MSAWKHLITRTICFSCSERVDSKYVVVGIPLDYTYTYRSGSRYAPDYIRRVSCELEFYSYLSSLSLEYIGFNDYGNIVLSPGDLGRSLDNITRVIRGIREEVDSESMIYIIGGEHLVTYPVFKVFSKEIDYLIVFDAHLDMRNSYLDSFLNHATVLRRVFEEYHIPVTYIGARSFSSEELDFIDSNKDLVKVCTPDDLFGEKCELNNYGSVYISIDIDVLDPVYAPGVSNPEPLGISLIQLLKYLYKVVLNSKRIVAIDLVEVNPVYDASDLTSISAAKIFFELTGLFEKTK